MAEDVCEAMPLKSSQLISDASPPMSFTTTLRTTASAPAFLIYRPFDSDRFEEIFHYAMAKDDVVSVLTTSLSGFERVVEHLRVRGEPEIANEFAKKMLGIVSDFNDITADWDIEKCLMDDTKIVPTARNNKNGAVHSHARTLSDHLNKLKNNTWAAIAAIPTHQQNDPVVQQPGNDTRKAHSSENAKDEEGVYVPAADARVVWVRPKDPDIKIDSKLISKVITQGPLFSIMYSPRDHAVCVIFQHAHHAREFLSLNDLKVATTGYSVCGSRYDVLPGLGFSDQEELSSMDYPKNERRRLTFVRSALFCDGLTEEKFKKDLYEMVGKDHVELVWLFNTGNATVVFSGVPVARKCLEDFENLSAKPGPYQGIQVSYSHDPCERPLQLVTQIGDPSARKPGPNRNAGSSYRSHHPAFRGERGVAIRSRGPSPPQQQRATKMRMNGPDGGWQTVGRRR